MSEMRVTTQHDIESRVPGWAELPEVAMVEGCVFMANPVKFARGVARPTSVDRFVTRMQRALDSGYMTGKLGPVMSIPLARKGNYDRVMLLAYFHSPKTMAQLNTLLGETLFTPEGAMGEEL